MKLGRLTSATLSALAIAALASSTAFAAPGGNNGKGEEQRFSSKSITSQEAQAAAEYWTPERMKNAIPADVLAPKVDTTKKAPQGVAKGNPQSVAGKAPTAKKGGKTPEAGSESPVPNIGKVFFKIGTSDYVCSGNVVTASNKSTVSTAGHCVNAGPGAYYTNFVFVPAYLNGNAPYGKWTAQSLNAPTQWVQSGDFEYDTAFVKLNTLNGQTVQDRVGSSGVAFNQATGLTYKSFGYPQAAPFDGQSLKSCTGAATPDPYGSSTQGISCDMTGGSSGGPWFIGTNPQGQQNSVNSYGYSTVPNKMFGPYWGSVIQSLYNTVQAS